MKKLKPHIPLVITLIISLFLTACSNTSVTLNEDTTKGTSTDKLLVHYIDVGQGDAVLVQGNGKNLLIDAGPRSSTKNLIKYLKDLNITKLDYVVATHPHEDHIGGMDDVINTFSIGEFYAPKKTHTTKTYEDMIKALKKKDLKITVAKLGAKSINLGDDIKAEFLAPIKDNYDNLNNYSAVLKITHGDNSFLFTGDAEKESEREMIQNNLDLKADVLKLGHHGSSTSTSQEFLDKVNPSIVVASLGKGNDYGHPHKETLTKIKNKNLTFYRTDESGSIVLESDGKDIKKK